MIHFVDFAKRNLRWRHGQSPTKTKEETRRSSGARYLLLRRNAWRKDWSSLGVA